MSPEQQIAHQGLLPQIQFHLFSQKQDRSINIQVILDAKCHLLNKAVSSRGEPTNHYCKQPGSNVLLELNVNDLWDISISFKVYEYLTHFLLCSLSCNHVTWKLCCFIWPKCTCVFTEFVFLLVVDVDEYPGSCGTLGSSLGFIESWPNV